MGMWTDKDEDGSYYGKRSEKFWARIKRLPPIHHNHLYTLGCILQDCELRTLRALRVAEDLSRKKKRK